MGDTLPPKGSGPSGARGRRLEPERGLGTEGRTTIKEKGERCRSSNTGLDGGSTYESLEQPGPGVDSVSTGEPDEIAEAHEGGADACRSHVFGARLGHFVVAWVVGEDVNLLANTVTLQHANTHATKGQRLLYRRR